MKITLNYQKLFADQELFVKHVTRIDDRLRGTPHDLDLKKIAFLVLCEVLKRDSGRISFWKLFYSIMLDQMLMRDDAYEVGLVIFETAVEVVAEVDLKDYAHNPALAQKLEFLKEIFEFLSGAGDVH